MSNKRKLVFVNNEYYHIYNRGIDRRLTFTNKREYGRAMDLLSFYQYDFVPIRYSHFIEAPGSLRQSYQASMRESGKIVEVIAFCLMPNHFHLLIKQKKEKGIATFIANFMNAYTKYFNTKYERTGSLFQGVFKAVYVESDEQLVHLVRYLHLNPVASSLITQAELDTFQWSSHTNYLNSQKSEIVEEDTLKMVRELIPDYKRFIIDQIAYAKELEKIKHMTFEHD